MNRWWHYCCWFPAWALLSGAAAAQSEPATSGEIQDYLQADYFEIEFFVFERPAVMDFNSAEVLALDRPRALPLATRTQRLDPMFEWPLPLDARTRACLTFPTLRYELLPPADSLLDEVLELSGIGPQPDSTESATLPDTGLGVDAAGPQEPMPLPVIEPYLGPDPLLDLLEAVADFEASLNQRGQRWLDPDSFLLSREAARVERTGTGRLLFHGRWLQAVPPRESQDPILIEGGQLLSYPVGVRELVGTVGVSLGRYLHFQAELFFHAPGLGVDPVDVAMQADGTAVAGVTPLPGHRYMLLSESRRMRSTEVHYLDHPKLGLVVRIDPVAIPSDLVEALDRFEQSTE